MTTFLLVDLDDARGESSGLKMFNIFSISSHRSEGRRVGHEWLGSVCVRVGAGS